jgi:hypothetical protein
LLVAATSWCGAKPLPAARGTIQQGILDELKQVPRPGPFAFQDAALDSFPAFAEKELDRYKADSSTWAELKKVLAQDPDKPTLRWATLKAVDGLQEARKLGVKEKWDAASARPEGKVRVLEEQRRLAMVGFELEEKLRELEEAGKTRDRERSRRWQAHYDYVHMAYLARLVFLSEYNYALGDIRAERLPALTPGAPGWRLASGAKLRTTEGKVKSWSRQMDQLLETIIKDHPGTPWALSAQRERLSPRGLLWQSGW